MPDAAAKAAQRPLLERFGLAYFRRRAAAMPKVEAMDEIHVLNPDELRALRRIERGVIVRAALAGALSALVSSVTEVLCLPMLGPDPDAAPWSLQLPFYGIVFGVTIVATIFEIGFLYWDALRSVHELARAAGLDLFEGGPEEDKNEVAAALARAALELPSPPRGMFDIDPLRESNRLVLVGAALAYKLKVGVSNFLLKALVRRALGRAALRAWLVFLAVPVTALWNAVVAWLVIREARLRAMGPSAAKAFADQILGGVDLSTEGRLAVLRAIGANIVRTHHLHPNLVAFLLEVHHHVGAPGDEHIDDSKAFLAALARLAPREQDVVLRVLSVGAILDGRITRGERILVREALRAAGRDESTDAVAELRRTFVSGRPVPPELVTRTAGLPA